MWHNPTHQVLNKHLYYHVCSVYFSETHIWYVRIWQRFDEVFLNLLGGKFLTTHSLHPSGLKKNDTSNESSYCHVIIIIHYIIIYSLYIHYMLYHYFITTYLISTWLCYVRRDLLPLINCIFLLPPCGLIRLFSMPSDFFSIMNL